MPCGCAIASSSVILLNKGKVSLKKVKGGGLFGLVGLGGSKTKDSSVHNTFRNFEVPIAVNTVTREIKDTHLITAGRQ